MTSNEVSIVSEKKQSVVVVRITGRDSTEKKANERAFSISENGESSFSGSGIIIDNSSGLIVTTATLFSPFIDPTKGIGTLQQETSIYVLSDTMASKDVMQEISWVPAKLLAIIPVSGLREAILGILGSLESWRVGWHVKAKDQPSFLSFSQYFDKIAIIQIPKESMPKVKLEWEYSSQLKKGEQVITIGSPFGLISPKVMMNSVSMGTVCNFITLPYSSNIPLFITDSKCIAGMEGGAIFNSKGKLIGMMLPPLRKKGSHVEFYFAVSSQCLIETLKSIAHSPQAVIQPPNQTIIGTSLSPLAKAEKSVVLITVEHHWGSGFMLSKRGYVLTTAHLVRPFLSSRNQCRSKIKIRVDTSPQDSADPVWTWFEAQIVFTCLEESHVDAVLLQIVNHDFSFLPINFEDSVEYSEGQKISIFGYPVYVPDDKLRATLTTGIISKVVTINQQPCLLETTAAVHVGNSGGVLLTMDGKLLGMVTSNARQIGSNKVIPRLNFSVPREELTPFLQFAQEGDISILQNLDKMDELKKTLWNLQHRPPLRPTPTPKAPSKFQSFMEEMGKASPKSKL